LIHSLDMRKDARVVVRAIPLGLTLALGSCSPHPANTPTPAADRTPVASPTPQVVVTGGALSGERLPTRTLARDCSGELSFDDERIEAVVRDEINRPRGPLFAKDVAGVQQLAASGSGAKELGGIECLPALRWVFLNETEVTDLSPLEVLTNITWVEVRDTHVSDVSPLRRHRGMVSLWLNTDVADLGPLAGMSRLHSLYLGDSQVHDLTPLVGLHELKELDIPNTQVRDLTPLSGLTRLETLGADGLEVKDLGFLSELTNLKFLWLNENDISDISPLARLPNLVRLDMDHNRVHDLTPLAGLEHLQMLSFRNNQISDLTPLAGLTHLTHLILEGNQVHNLQPLVGQDLWVLALEGNPIDCRAQAAALRSLRRPSNTVRVDCP